MLSLPSGSNNIDVPLEDYISFHLHGSPDNRVNHANLFVCAHTGVQSKKKNNGTQSKSAAPPATWVSDGEVGKCVHPKCAGASLSPHQRGVDAIGEFCCPCCASAGQACHFVTRRCALDTVINCRACSTPCTPIRVTSFSDIKAWVAAGDHCASAAPNLLKTWNTFFFKKEVDAAYKFENLCTIAKLQETFCGLSSDVRKMLVVRWLEDVMNEDMCDDIDSDDDLPPYIADQTEVDDFVTKVMAPFHDSVVACDFCKNLPQTLDKLEFVMCHNSGHDGSRLLFKCNSPCAPIDCNQCRAKTAAPANKNFTRAGVAWSKVVEKAHGKTAADAACA